MEFHYCVRCFLRDCDDENGGMVMWVKFLLFVVAIYLVAGLGVLTLAGSTLMLLKMGGW